MTKCIKCGKDLGIEYWEIFNHKTGEYENYCLECYDKVNKKGKTK